MGKCVNHPERDTNLNCMKHGIYMCEDCLACRDPKIHCKHRPSCPIWFMVKRGGGNIDGNSREDNPDNIHDGSSAGQEREIVETEIMA